MSDFQTVWNVFYIAVAVIAIGAGLKFTYDKSEGDAVLMALGAGWP